MILLQLQLEISVNAICILLIKMSFNKGTEVQNTLKVQKCFNLLLLQEKIQTNMIDVSVLELIVLVMYGVLVAYFMNY